MAHPEESSWWGVGVRRSQECPTGAVEGAAATPWREVPGSEALFDSIWCQVTQSLSQTVHRLAQILLSGKWTEGRTVV